MLDHCSIGESFWHGSLRGTESACLVSTSRSFKNMLLTLACCSVLYNHACNMSGDATILLVMPPMQC